MGDENKFKIKFYINRSKSDQNWTCKENESSGQILRRFLLPFSAMKKLLKNLSFRVGVKL